MDRLAEAIASMETAGTYIAADEAAKLLELSEKQVEMLRAQGRLETKDEDGERRYYVPSLFSYRIETLMRLKLEGLKEDELQGIVAEVAALQHSLGHTRGVKEAVRKLGEGMVRPLRPEPADKKPETG